MATRTTATFNRTTKGGSYCDILDAANQLAGVYGSVSNAIAQMARSSPLYKKAMKAVGTVADQPDNNVCVENPDDRR